MLVPFSSSLSLLLSAKRFASRSSYFSFFSSLASSPSVSDYLVFHLLCCLSPFFLPLLMLYYHALTCPCLTCIARARHRHRHSPTPFFFCLFVYCSFPSSYFFPNSSTASCVSLLYWIVPSATISLPCVSSSILILFSSWKNMALVTVKNVDLKYT